MVEYLCFIFELWLCLDAVVPEKEEDKSKQATRAMKMLFILLFVGINISILIYINQET